MKPWIAIAGLTAATSVATAATTLVQFNEKLLALSRGQGHSGKPHRFLFNTLQDDEYPPPSGDELSINYYGGSDRIACSLTETKTNSGTATVVLAISKCLNESSLQMIENWIAKVQAEDLRYNDNGEEKKLTFDTTLIPGACQERSELEKSGREARNPWTYKGAYDGDDEKPYPVDAYPGGEYPPKEYPEGEGEENPPKEYPEGEGEEYPATDEKYREGEGEEYAPKDDKYPGDEGGEYPSKEDKYPEGEGGEYRTTDDKYPSDEGGEKKDESKILLAAETEVHQVLPHELARIQAFAKYGRVLESIDEANVEETVAVMSFVGDETSFDFVTHYETKYHISNTLNFQICKDGESCDGHFENCIQLEETVDLFLYNPFQIARSLQCTDLAGGIPVTYMNSTGQRDCFCTCPAGTEMQEVGYGVHQCVEVDPKACPCVWSKQYGYKHEVVDYADTCSFSGIATDWNVAVPFPSDNYVSDARKNANDGEAQNGGPEEGPRVDVVVTPLYSDEYAYETLVSLYETVYPGDAMPELPPSKTEMLSTYGVGELGAVSYPTSYYGESQRTHYTWSDYQQHAREKIDAITFSAYGKYQLSIEAFDYDTEKAECIGCVAVVDRIRPKATTTCPTGFCDNTGSTCATDGLHVAELTDENLEKAKCLLDDFYTFKTNATNDGCNSERCDEDTFLYRNFFESEYAPCAHGSACFDKHVIVGDFQKSEKATTNPLENEDGTVSQSRHPVPKNQCLRCCQYSTKLREFWVDYTCGSDYDVRHCDGDDSETCAFEQCLLLTGDMVVEAHASIKEEVTAKSTEVLKGLRDQGYQTVTQIHHAVPCSDLDANNADCTFVAKVQDLIDVSAANVFDGSDDNTYAFWRYRIGGDIENWQLWDKHDTPYVFSSVETKITLEAWTACGRARKFFFYVHVHPHTDIKVCEVFKQMWYQTSQARAAIPDKLCTYPGSDFAELTFDYQANIGLKHARSSVRMHIQEVACNLTYQDRAPVEILNVVSNSTDIVERFAVELVNLDETAPLTPVRLTCTFTYADEDGDAPVQHTCPLDFSIEDCNGPHIDSPHAECSWAHCAGNNKPGPFEACGGKVVRTTKDAAYLDTEDHECCNDCDEMPLECVSILNLPDAAQDIKRCQPTTPYSGGGAYGGGGYGGGEYGGGEYGEPNAYGTDGYEDGTEEYSDEYATDGADGAAAAPSVFLAKAVAAHPTAAAATALVAASGLVALVSVVVVRRRRARAAEAEILADAYYPLLH